jgi:hypothetical protein
LRVHVIPPSVDLAVLEFDPPAIRAFFCENQCSVEELPPTFLRPSDRVHVIPSVDIAIVPS